VVGAAAVFLPSFVLMLACPDVRPRANVDGPSGHARDGPAVISVLAVSLLRLAPHALGHVAVVMLGGTVIALAYWRVGTLKLMLGGSVLGCSAVGCHRSKW
jgi:hypothetical protein